MVVCKFFQQGNCRYGQNCRFEHVYSSKYSYNGMYQLYPVVVFFTTTEYNSYIHAGEAAATSSQQQSAPTAVTDDQLVNQVHSDVQAALRGGQWILSSYAPFKEKAAIPGISDLSPEEARLFIYEAKASNNLEQAVNYMNNLFSETRQKFEQLLQKNPNITKLLRSLYRGENTSSPFGTSIQNNSAASSVFRSAVQTTPGFTQNATPSIFNQNAQNNQFNQNVFNAPSNADPAKSIFAQASQSIFNNQSIFNQQPAVNQTPFNQAQETAQSIFAQASQTTQNVFNQAPPKPADIFAQASQSIFGASEQKSPFAQTTMATANVFQKPQNVFDMNQNVFNQNQNVRTEDSGVYSKLEDLSQNDLDAFNSEDFKMGFVPELPPPHSLCF